MGTLRLLAQAASAASVAWASSVAFAQADTPTSVTLARVGVTHSDRRSNDLLNSWLNAADCFSDDGLDFPLTLVGSEGLSLEVWAGSGCDSLPVRTSTNQQACWRVYRAPAHDGTPHVRLPVRQLLYGRTQAADPAQFALGVPTSLDAATACRARLEIQGAQALRLYFLLVDGALTIQGNAETWDASFKLSAPPPPTSVAVGVGSGKLLVHFVYETPPSDATLSGYHFYCDPPLVGSQAGAPTTTDQAACSLSALLSAGSEVSDAVRAGRCGSAAKSASLGYTDPLTAGVAYNLAVTAVDSYANESVLSRVVCEVPDPPQAVDQKSAACAFSPRRETFPRFPWLGLLGFLALRRACGRSAARVAKF